MKNGYYKKRQLHIISCGTVGSPMLPQTKHNFFGHILKSRQAVSHTRTAAGLCKMVIGYQLIEISNTSLKGITNQD
jgi:hypothetical protein